jgi:hypothetical protein
VPNPSFAFVVDDGCREKVKEAHEEDPAISGFDKKKGKGQSQDQGDPGFFEEPVDGGVDE